MIHKIWDKDVTDSETGGIKDHLIKNFTAVHFNPPNNPDNPLEIIADSLIKLVSKMDLAELTSLEQLIYTMASGDSIPEGFSDMLWRKFSSRSKTDSVNSRKCALQLLGMLGKANKEIISEHLDVLTRVGLCELSHDFTVARYACIAVQQMFDVKREKGSLAASYPRKSSQHPTCVRICQLLLERTDSDDWYAFAEQAISALYGFIELPDIICGDLIKKLTARVFNVTATSTEEVENLADMLSNTILAEEGGLPEKTAVIDISNDISYSDLSQLVFVVGHVALKQIVHLEAIEGEWKRRKHCARAAEAISQRELGDLDMVTGTAEDEFVEGVHFVREKELLYGPNSLLGAYSSLITYLCQEAAHFDVRPIMT